MDILLGATCPHCHHVFETEKSIIDAINISCGISSPDHPEEKIGGYSLWFRGWIESQETIDLRGFCMATSPDYVYCLEVGANVIHHAARGQSLKVAEQCNRYYSSESNRDDLVHDVRCAMDTLRDFISEMTRGSSL